VVFTLMPLASVNPTTSAFGMRGMAGSAPQVSTRGGSGGAGGGGMGVPAKDEGWQWTYVLGGDLRGLKEAGGWGGRGKGTRGGCRWERERRAVTVNPARMIGVAIPPAPVIEFVPADREGKHAGCCVISWAPVGGKGGITSGGKGRGSEEPVCRPGRFRSPCCVAHLPYIEAPQCSDRRCQA
jgi:hypothetical protein